MGAAACVKSLSEGNERPRIPQRNVTGAMISALSIVALGNDTTRRQIGATQGRVYQLALDEFSQSQLKKEIVCVVRAASFAQASGSFFLRLNPSLVVSFPLPPSP